ncbi:MAG: YigZ family protein [Chloroflexia bacterium]|nr:YigZ family protein [Chloroflexia bacterium]
MIDTYKTIKTVSEGVFKDRGSKFFAFAFPVENENEINEYRAELRKKYYDARHHVYAFHIGAENPIFRASDDGEPANSSGPPVLGQIRSSELTNILVVVVRYFGGTKLGVPGLINAYKSAALDAIENAEIIEKIIEQSLKVEFEYPHMNEAMRLTKADGIRIASQSFEISCNMELMVKKACTSRFIRALQIIIILK